MTKITRGTPREFPAPRYVKKMRKILNSCQNGLVLFSVIMVIFSASCQGSNAEKRDGHEESQPIGNKQLNKSSNSDIDSVTPVSPALITTPTATVVPTPRSGHKESRAIFVEAPEFELVDATGSKISLSNTLFENELAILIFYRGHF